MLGVARRPSICTTLVRMSPCCETISLSKKRPKKWRTSKAKEEFISRLLHHGHDFAGRLAHVFLLRKLPEDLFQRGQVHEVAQAPHFIVRYDLSLVQHDHSRADF